ncbi:MAG: cobyrinate a,c-diamide synthase [Desulfosalsimonas sp.]|uniref:cobyrinate a,c-diamide synthase n=1 Tax=Desulfosalsimonas sp. TaxID=3073848 RepID=UPI003970AEE5
MEPAQKISRVLIAALRGGSGKTVVSIGLIAALARQGYIVAPFKKGPDYIDAGWLALAAGRPCHNLDPFLFSDACVKASFCRHSADADLSIIEGNRGLYDGLDAQGTTSTASLAKLLNTQVILCVDCTKTTRTMAAIILGCLHFDPMVNICGVILNRVAGARHERILRTSIESRCNVPVFGAIPKLRRQDFPERHMGLIPTPEHELAAGAVASAANAVSSHVDLERVVAAARRAAQIPLQVNEDEDASFRQTCIPPEPKSPAVVLESGKNLRIGVIRDSAFQFYYPENLDALRALGAEIVCLSPLLDSDLKGVHGLYMGGGFPETHAARLSENSAFRRRVKAAADSGLPVYAECGGLMYLGDVLVLEGETYPMAGVFPLVFGFFRRPQGHGYTIADVNQSNLYFPAGSRICGHEFHYSRVLEFRGRQSDLVFTMEKGRGIINGKDGLCHRNVLATYTHIHCLGVPGWAPAFVAAARDYQQQDGQ